MPKIGDRFRSVIGDENALWVVRRNVAEDIWEAEVIESWDYEGRIDVFYGDVIEADMRLAELFGKKAEE